MEILLGMLIGGACASAGYYLRYKQTESRVRHYVVLATMLLDRLKKLDPILANTELPND